MPALNSPPAVLSHHAQHCPAVLRLMLVRGPPCLHLLHTSAATAARPLTGHPVMPASPFPQPNSTGNQQQLCHQGYRLCCFGGDKHNSCSVEGRHELSTALRSTMAAASHPPLSAHKQLRRSMAFHPWPSLTRNWGTCLVQYGCAGERPDMQGG